MNLRSTLFIFVFIICIGSEVRAQPAVSEEATYATPSFIGVTILGNPALGISSVNDYLNGVTVNHNTLQLNVSLGLTWSLQVRASDDLRYQTYSIPASAIGVQAISLGTRPEIFLSTNNQVIASGFATSLLNALMLIRYRIVGGSHLLKPGGTYSTTLIFTYSAL